MSIFGFRNGGLVGMWGFPLHFILFDTKHSGINDAEVLSSLLPFLPPLPLLFH